jgi:DNA-binding NarL/FixJ family response regulator
MNSETPRPLPADSEQLAVPVRLETLLALEKLAAARGFTSAEDLLAEAARVIAGLVELSPADFRAIANQMEGGKPARQPKLPAPQHRGAVARLLQVLQLIATGKANCSTISEALECSPKTIQRDLDFIRDRLGVRVEFAGDRNAYVAVGLDFKAAADHVATLGLLGGIGAEVTR